VTELSAYEFSTLRGGSFTLSRGLGNGLAPILLVAPAGDYPSPESLQRLEHEFALRAELDADWAARPVELLRHDVGQMLVLEDHGGEPLDRLLGRPLDVATFLDIAIPLAAALGQVHAHGLIHKDVKPANILVNPVTGDVRLTGFGIASRLPREHQALAPPDAIAGTLAYMAPEQTGRMNRSVDSRSDLYALGVTFYEMLTGTLPFTAGDPMEWVHCHIARQPTPPDERVPTIPAPLAAIVLKLLAKTAEDRYQTAAGLAFDLGQCLADRETSGRIDAFPLGTQDASARLMIPEKLYGREREIEVLLSAFDRVVARATPELILVSGYSGVGKSSVVNELHRELVPTRGLFAAGKFDQYKRDIPYATLAQAFRGLVRPLLGQSEAALAPWREALREALGANGQLIESLVPELELVLGTQPSVADLPPQDAKHRFQTVFRRFVNVFARPAHPLVLFLDDLQWLDAATLDLVEHLVTHPDVQHLLLVGAYRDNEVGAAHPLMHTLATIRAAGARMHEVMLAPLEVDDVGRLVADALHRDVERARPLAQLIHEKTGGNPFFAIQFFTALADEGLLVFDRAAAARYPAWHWDIERIRAKSYTDNVVELMAGKLKRLSASAQDALMHLACLGNTVEIATLTLAYAESTVAMHAALWEAVQAGLVFRLEHAYAFAHDRIQQAAYSLIADEQRATIHLHIGRTLLAGMPAEQLAGYLFEVANQFNQSAALLGDRSEKVRVAALNLRAGRKAKASTAYASASAYLTAGMALLDEQDWASQYELTFGLWLERAECEFLSGRFDMAEQLIAELLRRAASKVDQAAVYQLKLLLHTVKSENEQGMASGLACLRLFGIDLPAHPTFAQVQAEYETVWQTLEGRPTEGLIDLPLMTDPEVQAAMQLLSVLGPPAYFTDFHSFCLIACRMVTIGMQHGISDASTLGFALLGFISGPVFHRYGEGWRFARLACGLAEKHHFIANQPKVYHATGTVAFWTQPIETAIGYMRATFRTAAETGDLTFACYGMHQIVPGLLLRNDPLDAVWRESEVALSVAREAKYGDTADIIGSQQRFVATMQGRTSSFSSFSDAQFDETAFEAELTRGRMPLMTCFYWILKLKARFLSGDHTEALAAADAAKAILSVATAQIQLLDYFYYSALTVAALYEEGSAGEQAGWRALLAAHRDQLREWADTYPPTFADKHALVSAEVARLEGREMDAMRLYDDAIRLARLHGFVQNEGLAHEVAARFYSGRGFDTFAHVYRRNARDCYRRWGADGKVRQLERSYPTLHEAPAPATGIGTLGASAAQQDLGAVAQASHAISGEIALGRLIETLMTIAVQHAGAERGLLILFHGDTPQIEAEARTDRKRVVVTLRQGAVTSTELPESLLHTVIRTGESVILDDALAQNPFSTDPYLRRAPVRSVLCLPLTNQGKRLGALYLENGLASHVFTPERISVLEMLASQAAISLENARLYAELLNEHRERHTVEEALRVSDERWRSLVVGAPVAVALTDTHGRYVATNPALQTMIGYSEAELHGRSAIDITHEDDRTTTEAMIEATAAGRPPTRVEKRYRHKDGRVIWAEVSGFPIPVAGSTPLLAGIMVDITDRKRAEDELRRSEASLADAQQISHTGSWRWSVGKGETSVSAELGRIFALDPLAPLPSAAAFVAMIHADDRPAFQDALDRAVRARIPFEHECRIVLPDGSIKHLRIVGRADVAVAGELEYTGVVMDITERRRAEEALRDAQADLTRAARLTTMGELAASLSHELRQPLAAIVMNGSAALRWLDRDPPDLEEARDAATRIVRDGQRADEVIRGLRALAMKAGPQLTPLDIDDVVQDVLALTRSEVQRHGVVLRTSLAASDRRLMGDRVQLQQVLLNLILNGVDAMNGVTDRAKELTVSSAVIEPGGVLVSVEDTGTGLDPGIAPRIFDPFFTTKADGLGMGLSICRSIIEAHGGRLWTSSRMPHGAALHFTVPAGARQESSGGGVSH
jgi:PAS domain S-box-containing protein